MSCWRREAEGEPVVSRLGRCLKQMQHDPLCPLDLHSHHTGLSKCGWLLWFLSVNTLQQHSLTCFFSWEWRAEGRATTSISPPQCGTGRRDVRGQTGDDSSAGCATILITHPQCNISWVSGTPTFATPENLIISQNIYYQVFNVTSRYPPLLWCMCFVIFCIILTNLRSWCLNSIFVCQSSFILAF